MKKIFCSVLCILFLLNAFLIYAPGFSAKETLSRNITSSCNIRLNNKKISYDLLDGYEDSYKKYDSAEIVIDASEPVGGVYIKFDRTPPQWTLSYKDIGVFCGKYGFLHEYQNVEADNVYTLTLKFNSEVSFADIYVLSRGDKLPNFVQVWRPAEGYCDIMLLACHSDDDQLFFAGSVPDAVSRGAEMQVCYFTNHWRSHKRPHELLNGLWTCGLDRYPVIGRFPDIMRVDSEKEMLAVFFEKGYTYSQMVEDQVELLRKYKPQIVLVHDINGEYGHGAHRLDSHSLRDAAELSNDPSKYTASVKKYGVWDVPKIYIHLYKQNKIDFEIDVPLQYFGGKTAYQVSQAAFRCHISQQSSRYRKWLLGTDKKPITDSHDFPEYGPRYYGLWKTTVGADVVKTDFYENIVLIKDQTKDQYNKLFISAAEVQPKKETVTEQTTAEETTAEEITAKEVTTEETTTEEITTVEITTEETSKEVTTEETTAAGVPTDEILTAIDTTEEQITEEETTEPVQDDTSITTAETTGAEDNISDTGEAPDKSEIPDTDSKETENEPDKTPENKFNPVVIIVICSVCIAAGAIAVIAINKRKQVK